MGESTAGAGAALDVVEHDFVEEPVVAESTHGRCLMLLGLLLFVMTWYVAGNKKMKGEEGEERFVNTR